MDYKECNRFDSLIQIACVKLHRAESKTEASSAEYIDDFVHGDLLLKIYGVLREIDKYTCMFHAAPVGWEIPLFSMINIGLSCLVLVRKAKYDCHA